MDIYTLDGLFRNGVTIMPYTLIQPLRWERLVATVTFAILVGGGLKKVEKDGKTAIHHKTGGGIIQECTIIQDGFHIG
jgi:ABC-type tungstate transport system substrate-binding protein